MASFIRDRDPSVRRVIKSHGIIELATRTVPRVEFRRESPVGVEHLNPVVSVRHVHEATSIDRYSARITELPVAGTRSAKCPLETAAFVEDLHPMIARVGHDNLAFVADRYVHRSVELARLVAIATKLAFQATVLVEYLRKMG